MRLFCSCAHSYIHLFFFYCYRPHLDLHSFPTRRSSDLEFQVTFGVGGAPAAGGCAGRGGGASMTNACFTPGSFLISRSEEHTSELQSHVNLVCRLLLEKKKKKI